MGRAHPRSRRATLKLATGIVNIWTAAAGPVAESFHRIEKAYPAASCSASASAIPRRTQEYRKPIDALTEYLDKLDEYGVPKDRRVVAALGAESAEAVGATAAAGAHPYLTTPEHTAEARKLIGPERSSRPSTRWC